MSDRLAFRTSEGDLTLSPHDSVHKDFESYNELMGWLKDLDRDKYNTIKKVSYNVSHTFSFFNLTKSLIEKYFSYLISQKCTMFIGLIY